MAVAGSLTYDTKLDTKGFNKGISKLGGVAKAGFGAFTKAVTASTVAIGALVATSVKAYANYEQLVGGVDTLFKDSSKKLQEYANEAYKTAGMSANKYMETATSFSASLLQSLGGDTKKATEYANNAIVDMSDNANKMGTSMEMIQNAYQGFAKQNYTMLDNLKLGYGGTKEEMGRLIEDANKLKVANGEMANLSIHSFADVTEAIHLIQTEMGITGTTAKEASTTIEGSLNMVKASWENLLVGISNKNADLNKLVEEFIASIGTFMNNLLPVVEVALNSVVKLIEDLFPRIATKIPELILTLLPKLVAIGKDIIVSLITGLKESLPQIIQMAIDIIMLLVNTFIELLPDILEMGIQIIVELIKGIAEQLPELIPTIVEAVILIVETLIDNIDLIIDAGIELIIGLAEGLIEALPILIEKIPILIENLVVALTEPEMLMKLLNAGIKLILELGTGLIKAIPDLIGLVPRIITNIKDKLVEKIKETDWSKLGNDMLNGLLNGLINLGDAIRNTVRRLGNKIVGEIKSFFGIHSPSKLMEDKIGKFIPQGIAVGIEADTDSAIKAIDQMNDDIMDRMNKAVNVETAKASFKGTSGSVSEILNANNTIRVENYNTLELDGEKVYENQQNIQKNKNLQYSFGGAY